MGRDAVQGAELVGAKAEDIPQLGSDRTPAAMNQRLQPGIEVGPVAQYPGGKFVRQAAVGFRKFSDRQSKCLSERLTILYRAEDTVGRAAGAEPGLGHPTIPVLGLEGTATSRRGMRPAR